MLPSERHEQLLALLEQKKVVTIAGFVEKFNISTETVRRDLNFLEKQGRIEKVYGGARLKESTYGEPAIEERFVSNIKEKLEVGEKCARLINSNDSIYIDSGTTTFQIVQFLKQKRNLNIITNSLPVVSDLLNTCDHNVMLLGGQLRHSERSIIAYDYLFDYTRLNIAKSFICAGGVSLTNGISDYNLQEITTRNLIMSRSREVYLAIDHSKFEHDAPIKACNFDAITAIVTDNKLDKKIHTNYKKAGVLIS